MKNKLSSLRCDCSMELMMHNSLDETFHCFLVYLAKCQGNFGEILIDLSDKTAFTNEFLPSGIHKHPNNCAHYHVNLIIGSCKRFEHDITHDIG